MSSLVDPGPRSLGALGDVGPLALGQWRYTTTDLTAAQRLLEAALDAGLDLVDTADVYGLDWGGSGFGACEELLGRVLAGAPGLRDRMVLATKGGIVPPVPYDSSPTALRAACEASLRRLQTDVIDLYQVHRPDMLSHPADVAATLAALREEGKIREVGVSNHTPDQVAALAAHLPFPLTTNQPEYSAVHLAPLRDGTFDACMRDGVTPLVWSPLAGGRLATGDGVAPSCWPRSTASPHARPSTGPRWRSRSRWPIRHARSPSSAPSDPSASPTPSAPSTSPSTGPTSTGSSKPPKDDRCRDHRALLVLRPVRRRLRVPGRARPGAGQQLAALPRHRPDRRPAGLRQRAAAVGLHAGHRLDRLRRRDRHPHRADPPPPRRAHGRDVAAAARPPAGHDRPDGRGPADDQHHLLRHPRRGAGVGPALPAHPRVDGRAAPPARRRAPRRRRRLRAPARRPAAGPHRVGQVPADVLRGLLRRRQGRRRGRGRRLPHLARHRRVGRPRPWPRCPSGRRRTIARCATACGPT